MEGYVGLISDVFLIIGMRNGRVIGEFVVWFY